MNSHHEFQRTDRLRVSDKCARPPESRAGRGSPSKPACQLHVFLGLACFLARWVSAQASTNCVQCPSGLMGWWSGDGNASNLVGVDHGTMQNGVTNSPGLVGDAFGLDGANDRVAIPESCATDLRSRGKVRVSGPLVIPSLQVACLSPTASRKAKRRWGQAGMPSSGFSKPWSQSAEATGNWLNTHLNQGTVL